MAASSWRCYGVALLSAALALLLGVAVTRVGYGAVPVFLAAVMVSAWYGGLGPGLLVTLLASVALEFLPVPDFAVDIGAARVLRLGVFVLVALLISSLNAANRRLQEALQAEYRRKDEFLALLAHELRNPLGALLNAVHVLRGGPSDPSAVALGAGVIERQARHMSRLVNDLLDISRIGQGKLELHRRPVDVSAVVRGAAEATRFLTERKGQALEVAVPEGQLIVDADPTRLEQVVVNLLTNAAKFTGDGGHIRVSAEAAPGWVLLRVRDDGAGIAPDLLPRVFDLHVQAHNGWHGGLGIGLNLVRSLAEMQGGQVTAFSAGPGHGSEFVVRLPACQPDAPARPADRGRDLPAIAT